MLREFVQAAATFRKEDEWLPVYHKRQRPRWVVEVLPASEYRLMGPYDRQAFRELRAPSRQRSGKPAADNLKPYLLIDNARYSLGIPEQGRDEESQLLHESFVNLLEHAARETGEQDLNTILHFLRNGGPKEEDRRKIQPRDVIAFSVGTNDFLTEHENVQRFWANYLSSELTVDAEAQCGICGLRGNLLRTLPDTINVMGQRCQAVSFNDSAFRHFNKEQTTNAPLCARCAGDLVSSLTHLTTQRQHNAVLAREDRRSGQSNPLRNQLAVFWLKKPATVSLGGRTFDLDELLKVPLALRPPDDSGQRDSIADMGQLEALLNIPRTADESALSLPDNAFYLAVLSANKGRLVIRDWLHVSVTELRHNLTSFLDAVRLVGPQGEAPRAFSIPVLLAALERLEGAQRRSLGRVPPKPKDPNLVRELVRAAYTGHPIPKAELLAMALARWRDPDVRGDLGLLHPIAAVMKLALTYERPKEVKARMERLDTGDESSRWYLSGQLLAVIEEAQYRAAGKHQPGTTLAERFYASAAAAPKAIVGGILLDRLKSAYLPRIRREKRGYGAMEGLVLNTTDRIRARGGFPITSSLEQQAEFGLGYFCQRSAFADERAQRQMAKP